MTVIVAATPKERDVGGMDPKGNSIFGYDGNKR
jgi:hypothetical protein